MTTVADCVDILESAYPPELAESWDQVGLICGDPDDEVQKVAFALDATQEVAEAAVKAGAQLLVVHHPLLLRGVHSVAANTPKGRIIHTLLKGGCALFAAHTNADSARPGVNDKLAELVGITPGRPIKPVLINARDHWGVHVPGKDAQAVKDALFAAGAGAIGTYTECSYDIEGTGQFVPGPGSDPTDGTVGKLYRAPELRIEFVAPRRLRGKLISVLRDIHPYEEPAFDITEMADDTDLETAFGLGRIGELPEEMTLKEFTQHVADNLPETAWGVRAVGDPEQKVKKVAVSSGSGDGFLDAVRKLGVDVYVTSDLRHHPVDEYRAAGGPAVIDTAHWASEFPWVYQAEEVLKSGTAIETTILNIRTDPWTLSAHKKVEENEA